MNITPLQEHAHKWQPPASYHLYRQIFLVIAIAALLIALIVHIDGRSKERATYISYTDKVTT